MMQVASSIAMILAVPPAGNAPADRPRIEFASMVAEKDFRQILPNRAYILVEGDVATRFSLAKLPSDAKGLPGQEVDSIWMLNPRYVFRKGGTETLFLMEVDPGQYAIYGLMVPVEGGGVGGVCACMGSVRFTAEAGKVLALGKVESIFIDVMNGKKKGRLPNIMLELGEGRTSIHFLPKRISDPRIPAESMSEPAFSPLPRLPNWYGLFVDRLMPVAGVFRYERDRQVDITEPSP